MKIKIEKFAPRESESLYEPNGCTNLRADEEKLGGRTLCKGFDLRKIAFGKERKCKIYKFRVGYVCN